MSMMVSFVLSFFPRDVLDEILKLIESVSEDFPSYSFNGKNLRVLAANVVLHGLHLSHLLDAKYKCVNGLQAIFEKQRMKKYY